MKMKKLFAGLLCLILILNASPICLPASAAASGGVTSTFSVTASNNTFTISRDSTDTAETVRCRTVGLSALPGIHFTNVDTTLTFSVGEGSKTVTVTETAVRNIPVLYRYQTGNLREYALEVLDASGFLLAEGTRGINYGSGYKFSNKYVNSDVTDLIYLYCSGGQTFQTNTSYYTDVAYSASTNNPILVKDTGYGQAVHTVSTSALFTHTGGIPADYFDAVGDDMYVTVGYTAQEVQDGFAYIQILADNDTTFDGNDSDRTVSSPSTSLYKACYEIDSTSATPQTSDKKFYFPHRYNYANRSSGNQAVTWTEFSDDKEYLYKQLFKSGNYRPDYSGSVRVSPSVGNINIRFNAGGDSDDDWKFKDLFVRLALADTAAPVALAADCSSFIPVKRSPVTVNVTFSEIVNAEGTVLHTSWGDLAVRQNSGNLSNVVPYFGFITAESGTAFSITGLTGTVQDLKGHAFSGTIPTSFSASVASLQTPTNTVNGYNISCLSDFYWYADTVSSNRPNLSAILTSDIIIPDTAAPGITALGGTHGFYGSFNGNGHKINNLKITSPGNGYMGLFSRVLTGGAIRDLTVENADISATTPSMIGGICGENNGTVENCVFSGRVSATVSGGQQNGSGYAMGGICGVNTGTVRNSMAINRSNTVLLSNRWQNMTVGGVAGKNSGSVEGCLFYGLYSEFSQNITRGAVSGSNTGSIENCVGLHDNSNYFSYAIGSDSGTSAGNEFLDASEFPNGHACWVLNGGVTDGTQTWYQTIGTDDFPCFSGSTVYKHGNNYVNEIVHEYAAVNWIWAPDHSSATAGLECVDCDAAAQVPASVSVSYDTRSVTYTATAEYNGQTFISDGIVLTLYDIIFKNYDGDTLAEVFTAEGILPVYPNSAALEKPADNYYVYTFSGWDPPITAAVSDAVYTARYTSSDRYYTINFYDEDGTLLQTGQYTYDYDVSCPTPSKESDDYYDYEFAGWADENGNTSQYTTFTVYGNQNYWATYSQISKNEYCNITFKNYDGETLATIFTQNGNTPVYPYSTAPEKPADNYYVYTFSGWDPPITAAVCDAVYTAQYTSSEKNYWSEPEWIWNGTTSATAVFTCRNDSSIVSEISASISQKFIPHAGREFTATVTGPDGKTYEDKKYSFPVLSLGKNTVSIPDSNEAEPAVFWFIPPESGYYRICSKGNADTGIEIYENDNYYYFGSDENSGDGRNFDCIFYSYKDDLFKLKLYSYEGAATVDIYIEKTNIRGFAGLALSDNSCLGSVIVDLRDRQLTNGVAVFAGYDENGLLTAVQTQPLTNGENKSLDFSVSTVSKLGKVKMMLFENFAAAKPLCRPMLIYEAEDYIPEDPGGPDDPPEDEHPDNE